MDEKSYKRFLQAKAIADADPKVVESLYARRSVRARVIDFLSSSGMDDADALKLKLILAERESAAAAESELRRIGLPADPEALNEVYRDVDGAIQTLVTAQEVYAWIRDNFPRRFRRNAGILDSSTGRLEPRTTGRWQGTWRSGRFGIEGSISMATCQIDDRIFGSGALSFSVFERSYVEGTVLNDDFNVSLVSDSAPVRCTIRGTVQGGETGLSISGSYAIPAVDRGSFTIARKDRVREMVRTDLEATRVLAVFASPRDAAPLRLAAEDRTLRECIRLSRQRDNIVLRSLHAAQIHDVRRALLDDDADIVHFSGHGSSSGLSLESARGRSAPVPPVALAELVGAYVPPLKCVVLNACYTVPQAEQMALKVPYVICMNSAVSDDAAIEFTRGFYDAIGAGRDVPFAFEEGRRTVRLVGLPDADTPVLLAR